MKEEDKTTRKRPKQSRSSEMLEDILKGTKIGLEKFGVDKLSSTKISKITGISVGSFYQYFKNKESAFVELSQKLGDLSFGNLEALLDSTIELPFRDRVDLLIDKYVEGFIAHKAYFRALSSFVVKFNKAEMFFDNRKMIHQKVTEIIEIESARSREDCEKLAYFLISNINGTLHIMGQENQQILSTQEVQEYLKKTVHQWLDEFMCDKLAP